MSLGVVPGKSPAPVVPNQAFLLDVLERDFFKSAATYTNTIEGQTWPAPGVPAFVAAAVTAARRGGNAQTAANGVGSGRGHVEAQSPWTSLTGFRMGA